MIGIFTVDIGTLMIKQYLKKLIELKFIKDINEQVNE